MNLYVVVENTKTRDLVNKSLDFSRFDKIQDIVVNGRNTIGSYARSVRLIAQEKGIPSKILVIFNAEGMDDRRLNIATAEKEEACITTNRSKKMRVFGYSTDRHNKIVNNIQSFLNK